MVPREMFLIFMNVYSKKKYYLNVLEIQNFGNEDIHIMIYFELYLLCIYFCFFYCALRLYGFLM